MVLCRNAARRGNLINNDASDTNYDVEKRLQIALSQGETTDGSATLYLHLRL